MQNIDFYQGKTARVIPQHFDRPDPELYSRMSGVHSRDEEKKRRRATRMISLIAALCIISFTVGIVIGIKFAGGARKEIVDRETYRAVSGIGKKVTGLVAGQKNETGKKIFPRAEYPFVIMIGKGYNRPESREIAGILSGYGHTVIISQHENTYRIYTGPYKSINDAQSSMKTIAAYNHKALPQKISIVKRR